MTFNRHENRTRIRICTRISFRNLSQKEKQFVSMGREGGWSKQYRNFQKSKINFSIFSLQQRRLPPFEGKTTNFRLFSYMRPVNKIILIFHPISRNYQDIFLTVLNVPYHALWLKSFFSVGSDLIIFSKFCMITL